MQNDFLNQIIEDVFLGLLLLFELQILTESLYCFTILPTKLFDLLTSLEIALMLRFFLDNLIMIF